MMIINTEVSRKIGYPSQKLVVWFRILFFLPLFETYVALL